MSSQWNDLKVKDAQRILQWWRETLHAKQEGDSIMSKDEKETSHHDPEHKTFSVDTSMFECCNEQHEMTSSSCCPTTTKDTSTTMLAASTLHIFDAFREERAVVTPYASEYCAEDGEPLFDAFKTLYDDSNNHQQQALSRDARLLWPSNPNHADHVLWAKQALDEQLQQQHRDIIQWVQTFCEPVQIPTKEWILLLPAREFIVEESLCQIKTLCWEWLISTLGNVLTDWGLLDESSSMTMIQGLMNPSLHDQWKRQEDRVPIQCLVFLARTYCAMKLLRNKKSRVPKSPTLLAKILRCVRLLQLPQHRAPDGMGLYLLYKLGMSRSSRLRKQQQRINDALSTSGTLDIMGGTNNKVHDSVSQDVSSSSTNVVTSWDDETDTTEEKLIKLYKSSADPFARRLLQQAMSIPEFLLRYPVEQLDMNTGHVLKTFPSGYQALGSIWGVFRIPCW